ncbi:MAG: dihydropteroate synthase [Aigarchaeota archaeon]|nr:dihydropteroate synthase [Candidatus Pelearchaeum maunauluense]
MLRASLAGLGVGDGLPVRIMGVINVSPESFYKGSVRTGEREILETAERMVGEGAEVIDVGGRSTAPYLETRIPVEEEIRRAVSAVKLLAGSFSQPVSIDTTSAEVARAALDAGARIVNDVYGFEDDAMPALIAESGVSAVVGARPRLGDRLPAVEQTIAALRRSLDKAAEAGVKLEKLVIDPAFGFYGRREMPSEEELRNPLELLQREASKAEPYWFVRDFLLLTRLNTLRELGRPILVGISRKSFLRIPTGRRSPEERMHASLAAEAYAVLRGAHIVRTHNPGATRDAVRVAEWIALTQRGICDTTRLG